MNRTPFILAPIVLALAGCAEPPIKLRADISWALSCAGTIVGGSCPTLSIGGKAWDFIQYDGELAVDETTNMPIGTVSATCAGYQVGADEFTLELEASVPGGEISISSMRVNTATNTVVAGGYGTFFDGVNTYGQATYGQIGTAAPTVGTPCQVTLFDFMSGTSDGNVVEIRLRCDGVANVASPTSKVSIRDAGAPSQPALLRFTGCEGF